ncbi:MAG TPA: DUF4405 domain-containing protein [Candidatus Brocadiia bacterium]|nr:DUF4405 domain-containing protein [Planctomycetota bacterium]MBI4007725.1 DUF4405 domain-containing protein [Planctomycetota bacterium]MDO8092285.1 DUF4405 domain-containing protein [Candidatus Brocadiales bacterium]
MKRNFNNTINLIMLFLSLFTVSTGFIIWFVIPRGHGNPACTPFAGMCRHTWASIHAYIALILIVIMVVHLVLHYRWLKKLI